MKIPFDDPKELSEQDRTRAVGGAMIEYGGRRRSGTIKFRTTTRLNIIDEPLVLENMMDNLATAEEIMEYITGLNKTEVKRYMTVHKLPADVVEFVSKTTVKLETT